MEIPIKTEQVWTGIMPDCPNVRLIIKASKRKGEDHYENYVKNIEALKGMCVGSASACGTASVSYTHLVCCVPSVLKRWKKFIRANCSSSVRG